MPIPQSNPDTPGEDQCKTGSGHADSEAHPVQSNSASLEGSLFTSAVAVLVPREAWVQAATMLHDVVHVDISGSTAAVHVRRPVRGDQ